MNYQHILKQLQADSRYCRNMEWGQPRGGHPEGSIRAHIEELEANLDHLIPLFDSEEIDKLRILIHVHDTLKPDAGKGVSITHSNSHASLARSFLSEFCDDKELLMMVQFHDEPYALWRQKQFREHLNKVRLAKLWDVISDWDLFNAFLIIDGCTEGKSRVPLEWWFEDNVIQRPARITRDTLL